MELFTARQLNIMESVIVAKILRGGLPAPRGGFKEGPLKNKILKYVLTV